MNREQKYKNREKELLNKWRKDFEDGKIKEGNITPKRSGIQKNNILKDRRVIVHDNGEIKIVETCVKCKVEYLLSPVNFNEEFNNSGIDNLNKESGTEQFCNTPKYGCRKCSKTIAYEKSRNSQDEYIRLTLKPYKKLNKSWFLSKPNICDITNMKLVEGYNCDWRVSVQNNGSTKEHLPEFCEKIAYELNVQQHNAIPVLKECWREMYSIRLNEMCNPSDESKLKDDLKIWFNNSAKQNGVESCTQILVNGKKKINPEYSKEMSFKHLKVILRIMLERYKSQDKRSKKRDNKDGEVLTIYQMYEILLKQGFKCYYTDIPFSRNRDNWRFFSLERLDNKRNHSSDNCVFICRMFNTAGGLNRKKILQTFLTQKLVLMTEEQKTEIKEELSKL